MAIFIYSATDTNGMKRVGTVDARNQEIALSLLKAQGLYNVLLEDINFNGIAEVTINETKAQVGGGSLPNEYIDSYAVCLKPLKISVAKLEEDLRKGKYHIISRIQNDMLILDVRTLFEDDFEKISAALKQILL